MNDTKVNNINKILQEIMLSKTINTNDSINDDDNEENGSYLFMINREWVFRAKIFIDYYIISCV